MVDLANQGFRALLGHSYPGRGIVIGIDETERYMVQVYWIMGRSENSRNRVLSSKKGRVFTEPADPAKVKDPSLIIYNAMRKFDDNFIVSNGHQTDDIAIGLEQGRSFGGIISQWEYEPDKPNYTPRITGICTLLLEGLSMELAICRKSHWSDACDVSLYRYKDIPSGFGFGITTYSGDGNPLPSYRDDPCLVPLVGDIETIKNNYWQGLNPENRVSLAVKFISIETGESTVIIENKFTKVTTQA